MYPRLAPGVIHLLPRSGKEEQTKANQTDLKCVELNPYGK
jgi:hypothetical protein